jgi:hypothetical protein
MRTSRLVVLPLALMAVPSFACASDGSLIDPRLQDVLGLGASALTLIASVVLLVIVLMLEKTSRGSVVADNISFMVAGSLCLSTSVLSAWFARFVLAGGIGASEAQLGADFLILVALLLFIVYFWRVRAALTRFTKKLSKTVAKARAIDAEDDVPLPGGSGGGSIDA